MGCRPRRDGRGAAAAAAAAGAQGPPTDRAEATPGRDGRARAPATDATGEARDPGPGPSGGARACPGIGRRRGRPCRVLLSERVQV